MPPAPLSGVMDPKSPVQSAAASASLSSTTAATPRRSGAHPAEQPFQYPLERPFAEPDWTRLPGYRGVTAADWASALWQRKHTIKNLKELKAALGPLLPDDLVTSI